MEEFKPAYPLIHNKVTSPRYVTPTLRRARLLDWLHANSEARAVVIAAGAGYGKTTLLWQWEQEVDFPCYWYKLDRNDRDWTLHISYLVEAVSQRHPGFGRRAHSILRQMGGPGTSRPGVTAFLLAEMHERLREPCTFIIDDWQCVASVTEVRGLWNQILRDAPPTCRFVFASRGKPRLQFARFKTHGGYAEIRTDELRLTEPEITELFRDVYRDPLTPDEARELERRTEGWAASLQLVEVSLRERRTPEERRALIESITATSDSDLFAFLAEEVLEQQTEETRNFLLSTSILQQITPELAERLAGVQDGTRRLLQLEHAGLFTERLDEARYRYHGLFRDFLERRLEDDRSDAEVTGLHIHAASYYETSTQWPDAIYHYLKAGLQRQAARLIARYGEEVVGEGRLGLVDSWLQELPEKAIRDNARLSLLHGEALGIRGEFDRALAALERARTFFSRKGDRRMQALALVKKSTLFSHWGRPSTAAEVVRQALPLVPRDAPDIRLRIEGNLAITYSWLRLPLEATQQQLMHVAAEAAHQGLDHYVAIASHNLGQVQLEMGDLDHSLKSLQRASQIWRQVAGGPFSDNYNLVNCLLAKGDYEKAADYASRGLQATRDWPRVHVEAACGAARVAMATGRLSDAIRVLEPHVWSKREFGASTEMVLSHFLEAKLLAGSVDAEAIDVATRLRERERDPRLAPETESVLAAAEHDAGRCQARCGHVAFETILGWRDRGGVFLAADALVKVAPVLLAHRESNAADVIATALRDLRNIGVLRLYRDWLRRLAANLSKPHRVVPPDLWPDLLATDCSTWARQLVDGADQKLTGPQRTAALAALEKHGDPTLLPILTNASSPDLVAARARLVVRHAPRLFVRTFGRLSLRHGGWDGRSTEITKKRERALLGFLVAHAGESLGRDVILEALWPDTSPSAAVNSLNQTTFQLRRLFDPNYRDGLSPPYIVTTPDSLNLNTSLVKVDWVELVRHASQPAPNDVVPHWIRLALSTIGGEFLQECIYDDWAELPRQHVRQTLRAVLLPASLDENLSADLRVQLAERLVTLDRYDEEAYVSMANALASSGRRLGALSALRDLSARLAEEQIPPSTLVVDAVHRLVGEDQ